MSIESMGLELGLWLESEAQRILAQRNWRMTVTERQVTSLDELRCHLTDTGEILVWRGGSDNTIFGSRELNYAARVVHDVVHLDHNLAFTFHDEMRVAQIQQQHARQHHLPGSLCKLLYIDTARQAMYERVYGHFPEDQMEFARVLMSVPGLY